MPKSPKRPKGRKAPQRDENAVSCQLRRAIEARLADSTVYAIGKASGVSPAMISRFLTGERGLTLNTADRLARALGLRLVAHEDEGV